MSLAKYYDVMIRLSAQDGASNVLFRVEQRLAAMHRAVAPAMASTSDKIAKFGLMADGIMTVTSAVEGFTKPFMEYEDSLMNLSSVTGLVGKQLENIGISARRGAMEFGTAAQEQINMYTKIVSKVSPDPFKGERGAEILEGIGRYVNQLAAISGLSRDITALSSMNMLLQTGVNFRNGAELYEKMGKFANILAASQIEGNVEIPEISNAFKAVGNVTHLMGFDFAETNAMIQTAGLAGKEGYEAGVAIRNMLTHLVTPLRGTKWGFDQLGISTRVVSKLMENPSKNFVEVLELFNTQLSKFSTPDQLAIIGKMFGAENEQGTLALIKGAKSYEIYLKRMRDLAEQNALANASSVRMNTVLHHSEQAIARLNDKLITFGKNISPPFLVAINVLERFTPQLIGLAALKFLMPENATKKLAMFGLNTVHTMGKAARGIEMTFARLQIASSRLLASTLAPLGRVRAATTAMMASAFAPFRRPQGATQLAMFVQPKAMAHTGTQMTMFAPSLLERIRGFTRHTTQAAKSSALFGNGLRGFAHTIGTGLWHGFTKATRAVWAFNTTLLTSPVFWVVGAIGTAAFLLWKNWDKVGTYLEGLWKGLSESLYPVKKAWDGVTKAFEPFLKAFDSLFAPSKETAKSLQTLGYAGQAAGKFIASGLNFIVPKALWLFSKIAEGTAIFFGLQESGTNAGKMIAGALSLVTLPLRGLFALFRGFGTFIGDLFAGKTFKDAAWNFGKSLYESFIDAFKKIFDAAFAFADGLKKLFSGEYAKGDAPALRLAELQEKAAKGVMNKRKAEQKALEDASLKQAKEQQQGFMEKLGGTLKKLFGTDDSEATKQLDFGTGKAEQKLRRLNKRLKADFSWIEEQNKAAVPFKRFTEPVLPLSKPVERPTTPPSGTWHEKMPAPKFPETNPFPKDLRFPDVFPKGQTTTYRFPEIGRGSPIPFPQMPTVTLPDIANNRFPSTPPATMPLRAPQQAATTQSKGSAITIQFGDIIINGSKAENPQALALEVEQALRRLGPDLARIVDDAVKQSQRLSFAGF